MNLIVEQLEKENQQSKQINLRIDNFICKDWNVYYDLNNPENFEDPENPPVWYHAADVYKYYEIPLSASNQIDFYTSRKVQHFNCVADLIERSAEVEKALLERIVHYTFENGGAYADAKHYRYAKRTMEMLHKMELSNEEFIKRNLRINAIEMGVEDNELMLLFNCGWDEEHGLTIYLRDNEIVSIE